MTLPKFEVMAHIERRGDMRGGPGDYVGTRGMSRRMEAFSITFDEPRPDGIGLRYFAHIARRGQGPWVADGRLAGERGRQFEIQGFAIELSGPKLVEYDVHYMTHVERSGDTEWVTNGTLCGTNGSAVLRAEGIAVRITPRAPQHVVVISKVRSGSGRPLAITASEGAGDNTVHVSVADGSDLQVWDRRPVKGGQGFALINKARPTRCLARGPTPVVVLRDVSRIDTDDDCVWLDGHGTGPDYTITSWSARNLRLRVGGARPYPDRGNELLAFPFTRDIVDHELWLEHDESYAAVAGTDDKALNVLSEAIHRGCHEEVFKGSISIGQLGIASVDYDMTQAPRFAIYDPATIVDPLLRRLFELLLGIANGAPYLVAHVERVTLAVTLQNGERYATDTSMLLGAVVRFNPDRSLTLVFAAGLVSFPPSRDIEGALNLVFIPLLRDHLNEKVLGHIRIPPLRLFDVEFAAPILATRYPHLLAATALPPDLSELPPASSRWPADKVFLGVDAHALNAVGKAALERLGIRDKWEYNERLEVCHLHLEAHYDVTLHNPRFILTPSGGNRYTVRIELGGRASFQFRCGIFHWTPTATASGSAAATADVSVDARNHVIVTFRSLDAFSLRWHVSGIPHWILERELEAILDLLSLAARPVVERILRGHAFDVYAIPTLRPTIAGKTFEITLRELALGAMADGDEKPLVLATGTASVTMP